MNSEMFISKLRVQNLEQKLISLKAKCIQKEKGFGQDSEASSEYYMDRVNDSDGNPVSLVKNKI
jgi:hypothetical protein